MKRYASIIFVFIFLISCTNYEQTGLTEESGTAGQETIEQKEEKDEKNAEENKTKDETKYIVNESTWYLEPIDEDVNEKVVLITIDDAPDSYASEMAEILKRLEVPAIFFVNGHLLEDNEGKETLKELDEMGFMIGNHTYSHQSLLDLSEEEQIDEIVKVNDQVEQIIGKRPIFFRAPFGQNTDISKKIIKEENMFSMNWSYGYDWNEEYMDKDSLVHIMINADELRSGANLLMHDRKWTSEALEEIILGLREKGYDFVDPATIKVNN